MKIDILYKVLKIVVAVAIMVILYFFFTSCNKNMICEKYPDGIIYDKLEANDINDTKNKGKYEYLLIKQDSTINIATFPKYVLKNAKLGKTCKNEEKE